MGGHLLHLYNSLRASRMKRLTANFPLSVKRYMSANHGGKQRAPSTEEELIRVAEEKGFASQTLNKAEDGAGEATKQESDFGSVKDSYKEPPGKGKFHRENEMEMESLHKKRHEKELNMCVYIYTYICE